MRTTLPDRPGALAALAATCGDAGVNILGLQIFPGVELVTDELVLRTPEGWSEVEISALLEQSGGHSVSAAPCTEAALTDQPTRYVQAARSILSRPASFPEVVAALFDAESDPEPTEAAADALDVMDMVVGEVQVQVRRRAPFTATEHRRGAAMAELVSDVLDRGRSVVVTGSSRLVGTGASPDFTVDGETVTATVDDSPVGVAEVGPLGDAEGVWPVSLHVDPGWQRRGIGTRLLVDAARLAAGRGAAEIVLTTRSDNQAVLPMVMAAGMRGRIRMAADTLTVRIPVRDLKPLPA